MSCIPLVKRKHQGGFAMVEVLVTAVIIAIGISGLGVLLMRAIQGTQDSAQQSQAMWMVQDYVGRIRANQVGARYSLYDLTEQPDCAVQPGAMCADYISSGTKVNADTCLPEQMAIFDKWITVCGLEPSVYDSSADFIVNPQIESTCTLTHSGGRSSNEETGAIDCVQYDVSLTWDIRVNNSSSNTGSSNTYSLVVEVN